MQDYFYAIAEQITPALAGNELFTCSFAGEDSEFVRFNRSQVRQAGSVAQRVITVDLIAGWRHALGTLTLSGEWEADRARLQGLLGELRDLREQMGDDPHLHYATEVHSSERRRAAELPSPATALSAVQNAGHGRDLVGIYAAGAVHAGFANAFGQRNWSTTANFNLDWSFFHSGDKAVKQSYAGTHWDDALLRGKVETASEQLAALARPVRRLRPGRYRVYLAPAALWEIMTVLAWGGFGLRAHRTKTTPLIKMIEDGARLHPDLTVIENTADGVAPDFQEAGFTRPAQVVLIGQGRYRDCLVSPRSAAEYGVPTNGASSGEAPQSLEIGGGALAAERVLSALNTGIYVSNLWYLNFSDRTACRTTGMTRFATFWVENGVIQSPLEVMRFDETIYRLLGEQLVALTAERELMLDAGSYFQRSTDSARLPGVLVDDFTLTL
jgi:predicted Zn-dependent protease